MSQPSDIEQRLKTYILNEFLSGEDPSQLTNTTPLVTSGVLDSIATLRFVSFLEQEFSISIDAHEVGAENFDTIESIARLVATKRQT
jgi:acyl carrier protein